MTDTDKHDLGVN